MPTNVDSRLESSYVIVGGDCVAAIASYLNVDLNKCMQSWRQQWESLVLQCPARSHQKQNKCKCSYSNIYQKGVAFDPLRMTSDSEIKRYEIISAIMRASRPFLRREITALSLIKCPALDVMTSRGRSIKCNQTIALVMSRDDQKLGFHGSKTSIASSRIYNLSWWTLSPSARWTQRRSHIYGNNFTLISRDHRDLIILCGLFQDWMTQELSKDGTNQES